MYLLFELSKGSEQIEGLSKKETFKDFMLKKLLEFFNAFLQFNGLSLYEAIELPPSGLTFFHTDMGASLEKCVFLRLTTWICLTLFLSLLLIFSIIPMGSTCCWCPPRFPRPGGACTLGCFEFFLKDRGEMRK